MSGPQKEKKRVIKNEEEVALEATSAEGKGACKTEGKQTTPQPPSFLVVIIGNISG